MSKQTAEKGRLHQQEENPSIWDRTSEQQSGYHKRVALEIIDQPELNDALEIAVLGRLGCTTDKLTLSFEKIWGASPVFLSSKSGWEASSDIWACPNKATRYPYEPTAENWAQLREAVKRYIRPFRQQTLEPKIRLNIQRTLSSAFGAVCYEGSCFPGLSAPMIPSAPRTVWVGVWVKSLREGDHLR